MQTNYSNIQINKTQAAEIALKHYGLTGEIIALDGELDFNFKLKYKTESYILKISRPNVLQESIDYQQQLLNYISNNQKEILSPKVLPNLKGNSLSTMTDADGSIRFVRLYSWIEGRVWSSVNPQKEDLLFSLGEQAGMLTKAFKGCSNP